LLLHHGRTVLGVVVVRVGVARVWVVVVEEEGEAVLQF
jgi:hypothetical protein